MDFPINFLWTCFRSRNSIFFSVVMERVRMSMIWRFGTRNYSKIPHLNQRSTRARWNVDLIISTLSSKISIPSSYRQLPQWCHRYYRFFTFSRKQTSKCLMNYSNFLLENLNLQLLQGASAMKSVTSLLFCLISKEICVITSDILTSSNEIDCSQQIQASSPITSFVMMSWWF